MKIYLYVKKHRITGLKYFGKTTNRHPYTYKGSGKYWKRHLREHGTYVDTISIWEFNDANECTKFAEEFSEANDIVGSKAWANLKPENGLDGGSPKSGKPLTPEHKAKLSAALKGRIITVEHRANISAATVGKPKSDETRKRISSSKAGKPVPHLQLPETIKKNALARTGKKRSDETRKKISEGRIGADNPFYGIKHSNQTKQIMSEKAKDRAKGRFWIVDKSGRQQACYSVDDPRLTSGECIRGTVWRDEPYYPCKICSTPIIADKSKRKYCSRGCEQKSKQKVDWDKIDLIRELDSKTMAQLAHELGVSRQLIQKKLKQL